MTSWRIRHLAAMPPSTAVELLTTGKKEFPTLRLLKSGSLRKRPTTSSRWTRLPASRWDSRFQRRCREVLERISPTESTLSDGPPVPSAAVELLSSGRTKGWSDVRAGWAQAQARTPEPEVKPVVNKVTTCKNPGPKAQLARGLLKKHAAFFLS